MGKMRHIEIRDLWLQKEVLEGKVLVSKVLGTENPADLMTKLLSVKDILSRLEGMSLRADLREVDLQVVGSGSSLTRKWRAKARQQAGLN